VPQELVSKNVILERQLEWALRSGRTVNGQGYLTSVEVNLLQPLSASALSGFGNGSGSELVDTESRPAKIKALHSSAALAVNVFDYWTTHDSRPLVAAMGLTRGDSISGAKSIEFERQYPTGLGGNPPNLDVIIQLDSGIFVAIESKFTEWMTPKSMNKEAFRPSYFADAQGVWSRVGLPCCQRLAEAMASGTQRFRWLDAPQLLKHALGLATAAPVKFSLHYLYFDFPSEEGAAHQKEIEKFSMLVGAEIEFVARSYQTLFADIVKHATAAHTNYVEYLRNRYFDA
jgi:hypothetical protein